MACVCKWHSTSFRNTDTESRTPHNVDEENEDLEGNLKIL